jgi:hypothetical protein
VDGDATYGYSIPDGVKQLHTVPFSDLDQISVKFSKAVLDDGNLAGRLNAKIQEMVPNTPNTNHETVLGIRNLNVLSAAIDGTGTVVTWTLAEGIPNGGVTIHVSDGIRATSDGGSGSLDGEWCDYGDTESLPCGTPSTFPSGNNQQGGDFLFSFRVHPGDALPCDDHNGMMEFVGVPFPPYGVHIEKCGLAGSCAAAPAVYATKSCAAWDACTYEVDINGDGDIDALDTVACATGVSYADTPKPPGPDYF